MSSLKSKVRFIIPLTMWQRFVNHEILLKRPFEVKELEETFCDGDFEKGTIEIREYTRGDGITKDVFVVREEEV